MFGVDLRELARAGSVRLTSRIEEDDPTWEGADVALGGPVSVDLVIKQAPTGQITGIGEVETPLVHECRRCLDRVDQVLTLRLALTWSPPDDLAEAEVDDGEIRALDPLADWLDVGKAVREELILGAPKYVVCSEECAGLCPRCGANLNEDACTCGPDEPDPRWATLLMPDKR